MNIRLIIILELSILLTLTLNSMPIYGKESSLKGEGNIKGIGEQIINLRKDYNYLENEIQMLLEECK